MECREWLNLSLFQQRWSRVVVVCGELLKVSVVKKSWFQVTPGLSGSKTSFSCPSNKLLLVSLGLWISSVASRCWSNKKRLRFCSVQMKAWLRWQLSRVFVSSCCMSWLRLSGGVWCVWSSWTGGSDDGFCSSWRTSTFYALLLPVWRDIRLLVRQLSMVSIFSS